MGLSLRGTTSGAIDINAPAVAGDNTITLPANNGSANQFFKNSGTAGIVTYSSMLESPTGNIGIGTDPGSRKVEIFGTVATVLQLNSSSTDGTSIRILNSGTTKMFMGLAGDFIAGQGSNVTDSAIRTSGACLFSTGASGLERLRITSAGKIGIGTATPATLLEVGNQSQTISAAITVSSGEIIGGGTGPTISLKHGPASGTQRTHQIYSYIGDLRIVADSNENMEFHTGGSESLRIDSSGRLLLGTTTEGEATADNFTIADSGHCGITLRSGDDDVGTIFFSDGTSGDAEYEGYVQYDHSGNYMKFATNHVERLRITSTGDLGVNIANPLAQLHVNLLKSSGSSAADRTKQHAAMRLSLDRTTGSMPYLGWGPALDFYSDNYDGDTQRPNARIAGVISNYSAGNEGGQLRFYTTPTDTATGESDFVERIRITSGGDLEIMTAGKGISFINAADTATNETVSSSVLDDYEEGTWTPSIGGNATYTDQSGTYVKVGRMVYATGIIGISNKGTGNTIGAIQGLPFTSGVASQNTSNLTWGGVNVSFAYGVFYVGNNSNTLNFSYTSGSQSGVSNNPNIWQNGAVVTFSITYYANS